jgi:hypothetical protein
MGGPPGWLGEVLTIPHCKNISSYKPFKGRRTWTDPLVLPKQRKMDIIDFVHGMEGACIGQVHFKQ